MASSALSPVLPQVVPARLGNTPLSLKKLTTLEDKVALKSFQAASCSCSNKDYSPFRKEIPLLDRRRGVIVRAAEPTESPPSTPATNSIICKQCEGNGAIVCSQCKGDGINKEDFFNGQFKAGTICWLCRGKRETLCGECNGAGFLGGFLSSFEE